MPYIVQAFVYRKPGVSPAAFKSHYESRHVPLLQALTGPHFPNSHTRRYTQRSDTSSSPPLAEDDSKNAKYPATVLIGTQADFDYEAFAELIFDDEAAFQTFFARMSQEEVAEKIAKDEEMFMDRAKMRVVIIGDCITTTRATTSK